MAQQWIAKLAINRKTLGSEAGLNGSRIECEFTPWLPDNCEEVYTYTYIL